MNPFDAALNYIALARYDLANGTHKAMAFAVDYESEHCRSEADFDIYLGIVQDWWDSLPQDA